MSQQPGQSEQPKQPRPGSRPEQAVQPKQPRGDGLIHVNLFEMNTVGHISHGLWVHPDNNRHRVNELSFWTDEAKLAEEGLFDAIFLADVIGAYDDYRGGPETALREAVQIPAGDPFLVIPAMAAVTTHLGFAGTFSTSYEPPFAFARRASTLDHLTRGRFGWNVVTSYLPNAARNFGLDDELPHDERYEIADEFLEVVYKLWEGSWDDGAVVIDRERRIYSGPDRVHYINHSGHYFRVKGPHLSDPSPQRTPVIFQAGSSPRGREFAAKHAEGVFVAGSSIEELTANVADIKRQAAQFGRDPADIATFTMGTVITGRTREEAEAKAAEFERLSSPEGFLTHAGGGGIDLAAYPRDTLISDILEKENRAARDKSDPSRGRYPVTATVGEALDRITSFRKGNFFIGTGEEVAQQMESFVDETGVSGFNLRQFLTPGTAEDFIEYVVPVLQRHGRYRTTYAESTLRERLGAPGPRLPDTHPAARFRGGAGLDDEASWATSSALPARSTGAVAAA